MLCTHNPVMGVPICVFLFAIAIVATIWKAISLMITRQRNLGLPSYAKPFSCFLLGVVNIVFSFYFLLRCVTHNWNWGYEMSLEHELRSSDFGFRIRGPFMVCLYAPNTYRNQNGSAIEKLTCYYVRRCILHF